MNWGNCMRCTCLLLPISWTISTFVLIIWILVGSTTTAQFPSDTYFLRMNISYIDPPQTIILSPGETIAEALGLHDFYQTGLWNFCEGIYQPELDWLATVTDCGPQTKGYFFNPIAIMSTELKNPYTIIFLESEVQAIQEIQNTAGWLRAAFVITALFTGFTLVIGPMTGVWHERPMLNCVPVCTMCVASWFIFMGAVSATNVYLHMRNAFNNDTRLNVSAHLGHQMFAWIWLAVWTAWSAASQWCCAALCCPGGHRKRRFHWRKVFKGFIPIPYPGTHVDDRPTSQAPLIHDNDHYPNPPPPAPDHHHGALAAGLAAAGGLAAAEAIHHHHHHNNPPAPPPPAHHSGIGGTLGAGLVAGAVATGAVALADHLHHQNPQQNQPPPQEHHHHHINPALAAGALGAAGGLAMAQHEHHQQQQQAQAPPPLPPPQGDGLGPVATAGIAAGFGTAAGEYIANQQQPAFAPPPGGVNPGIPIMPLPAPNFPPQALPPPVIVPVAPIPLMPADVLDERTGNNPLGPVPPPPLGPPSQGPPPANVIVEQPQVPPQPEIPPPAQREVTMSAPGNGNPLVQSPLITQPPPLPPAAISVAPIQPVGQVPGVAMAPPAGVLPANTNNTLLTTFPFAPNEQMVARDLNSLYGRDQQQPRQ